MGPTIPLLQGAANQFEMWLDEPLFVLVLIQRETHLTTFQIGLQLPVVHTNVGLLYLTTINSGINGPFTSKLNHSSS